MAVDSTRCVYVHTWYMATDVGTTAMSILYVPHAVTQRTIYPCELHPKTKNERYENKNIRASADSAAAPIGKLAKLRFSYFVK